MLLPVKQFKDFIKSYQLFSQTDKILLAVSGGKDSVAMAHLFVAAGYQFGIAHCNFNLRGEESISDQDFVKKLAEDLKVSFHIQDFETDQYAKTHKMSIQMAARELRYDFFHQIKKEFGYAKIAIAQHQNDAMETVLLNLIRGTGIAGLHGIKVERNDVIRPLLCFNSANIEEMLEENSIIYVEDSSNASNKYVRNKIRLDIIPEMKKLNPSLEDTFQKNMDYFMELEELLIKEVEGYKSQLFTYVGQNIIIEIESIKSVYPQKLILFELFRPFGFNITSVQNLLSSINSEPGKQFFSDTHLITLDRTQIILSAKSNQIIREQLIKEDQTIIYFSDYQFNLTPSSSIPDDFTSSNKVLYVDANDLVFPLKLRVWQEGDSFHPFGMEGEKKLSDYFISQKIPLIEKKTIPILVNGNGKIIWICGYRSDERFKVKNQTKKIFILEVKKHPHD
jgi:tRNA(Ile)-lysidine synthase